MFLGEHIFKVLWRIVVVILGKIRSFIDNIGRYVDVAVDVVVIIALKT